MTLAKKLIINILNLKLLNILNVIRDLKGEEIVGVFYEKELQKINQKGFIVEKVIKRKYNKLYVK